jgi:hypothetical protein
MQPIDPHRYPHLARALHALQRYPELQQPSEAPLSASADQLDACFLPARPSFLGAGHFGSGATRAVACILDLAPSVAGEEPEELACSVEDLRLLAREGGDVLRAELHLDAELVERHPDLAAEGAGAVLVIDLPNDKKRTVTKRLRAEVQRTREGALRFVVEQALAKRRQLPPRGRALDPSLLRVFFFTGAGEVAGR